MNDLINIFNIIKANFKGQFIVCEVYSAALIIVTAVKNGKTEMAERHMDRFTSKYIYGEEIQNGALVEINTKYLDVTGTLADFISIATKVNKGE